MIVKQLIEIQKNKNLTDGQFAQSLDIHRLSWVRNKRTQIISADVLLKALIVYPELKEMFLSSFEKPYQKPQNKNLWGRIRESIKSFITAH